MHDINKVVLVGNQALAPVFIIGSASLSVLGQGAANLVTYANGQTLHRLAQPLNCYYQAIPLAPIEESYQRIYKLLSEVIEQVITEQSLTVEQLALTSLFLGSSSMDIGAVVSQSDQAIWLSKLDRINAYLVKKYGLNDLHFTFSTACTSSSNALIYATRLVRTGEVKTALVIGCEFYNQLTLKGFNSLELLSEQGLHAFSKHRDGMVLGEGVGALLLSNQANDECCLAIMDGYSSCDSYSLTTTEEDGSKISEVIVKSIKLSGITAQNIQLIKAHGTASLASDQAEANALERVFGKKTPALALKPFIGHTLGACGVLELALLVDLVKQDIMPVPDYVQSLDQDVIDKSSKKHNTEASTGHLLTFVSAQQSFKNIDYILANHCGFGGNNAAFVLKNLTAQNTVMSIDKPNAHSKVNLDVDIDVIAQNFVEYDAKLSAKVLRKQVKQLTGFEVRRMDSFTLIALQALHDLFENEQVKSLNLDKNQLGLYGVGDYFSVALLQSLVLSIEEGEDVRPLDFISSVGNSANFYLAKQFNIRGVNLFTGASSEAIERTQKLAKTDLALGIVDYAILVHWQQNEDISQCAVSLFKQKAL
ncbi:hypothetical protein CXF85_13630 [Colwellia sp. 75C3]|uniref:beta-ketoacyl synthase N-terminal-like domain-containing protein n=1 Tax=Colwellia sp. 75C3 TaxID=888425 RepID=UPI000C31D377|nr:beta-ketoacyl synthase N-terminal-like domain-containing protein [Colwellia sp. 75C3]PKG82519.1 hypothetical protein CXF85_13630 [Colwellia sp. 75C3]